MKNVGQLLYPVFVFFMEHGFGESIPLLSVRAVFGFSAPHWGPLILEFVVAALAGFFVALPENTDLRWFSWRELLIGGIPVLVLALASIMY